MFRDRSISLEWLLPFTAAAALAASSPVTAQAPAFSVDFTWDGTAACFDPKSPPFSLAGVPPGTQQLTFVMKDLDAPTFVHGGGFISFAGQNQVSRGAFSYKGPCPPSGQHTYQWTVQAQDATGRTLATATVAKKFPPR
jgi:phosphatidylethanolamine-binding protein (PEBP) family uncharacterized protein